MRLRPNPRCSYRSPRGAEYLLETARIAPERVAGAVFIGPMFPYTPSHWSVLLHPVAMSTFQRKMPAYRWWARMNAVHWMQDYPEFAEWFITRCFPEPHSSKAIEDGVGWALDTDPATLVATALGEDHGGRNALRGLASSLRCPVLVIHGDRDKIAPHRDGRALARFSGGRLETVTGRRASAPRPKARPGQPGAARILRASARAGREGSRPHNLAP